MSIITSTNKLKVTELDFDTIKAALKEYLSGQSEFTDYNFDSSGMSILLDILAYNTHYNAFYVNMVASEMFLDSASIRSNVVSKAKQLGYTPSSKRGAEAIVDISIAGAFDLDVEWLPANITIPKGFKIASRVSGSTYIFTVTKAASATLVDVSDGTYRADSVSIREGVPFTYTQTAIGSDNELFEIPSEDVDTQSLEVYVNGEIYNLVDDYTDIKSTSKVYFLQEGDNEKYQVYFGDGVIGSAIGVGDTVSINYVISRLGVEGNNVKLFSAAEKLSGVVPTIVLADSNSSSYGGASRESISSIKLKAPRGFELQKRIVTAQDYKTRLINDYPSIHSVKVWGGEENDPPDYGKVYISLRLSDGYALSNLEKKHIKDTILSKRNVVTVSPVFVDPEFLYLVLDVDVTYDSRSTTKDEAQLKTDVVTAVTGFSLTDLNKFDNYFRHSVLLRKIDDIGTAIKNSSIGVKLRKEIIPTLNTALEYNITFDNELYHPHEGHQPIITSTKFNHSGYGDCYLEDSNGVVRVVTFDETQNKITVNSAAGTIDYVNGKIVLENFNPTAITDGTSKISITAIPKNPNVLTKMNTIISILDTDLTVVMADDLDVISDASPNY